MEKVWTVRELNSSIKLILESNQNLKNISLEGEVSDFKTHYGSGHIYLTLKDGESMIRAMIWKSVAEKYKNIEIKNGNKIKVIGSINHYVAGGSIGFVITNILVDGEGLAKKRFEELKNKYESMGWFQNIHKKKINKYPNSIAIITAKEGDAIHDITTNIRKKWKIAKLTLFPTLVQGDGSAENIVDQIKKVNECGLFFDTIILGRGGGSYEHLASFNEPIVVEAVFNSKIPIVTGIGHDKDETIAGFVSDYNASTPTGAGSESVNSFDDLIKEFSNLKENLNHLIKIKVNSAKSNIFETLNNFKNEIRHSKINIESKIKNYKDDIKNSLYNIVNRYKNVVVMTKKDLFFNFDSKILYVKNEIQNLKIILDANDISQNLLQGYSISLKDNARISSVKTLSINDELKNVFSDGVATVKVLNIMEEK